MLPEAEQALEDALAQQADNMQANRALGVFYMSTGRADEAEPHFQAIAKTANSSAASLALADYYIVTKRPEDATRCSVTSPPKTKVSRPRRCVAAIDVTAARAPKP